MKLYLDAARSQYKLIASLCLQACGPSISMGKHPIIHTTHKRTLTSTIWMAETNEKQNNNNNNNNKLINKNKRRRVGGTNR